MVIDRAENRHAAFGLGIHRCIGSNLARMEITVALQEWFKRIPEFTLDPAATVTWSEGTVRGPRKVPVLFGCSRGDMCRLPSRRAAGLSKPGTRESELAMPEATVDTPDLASRPFLLVAAVAGVLIAGTLALWAHYGTAVFFEMIAAGIAACF